MRLTAAAAVAVVAATASLATVGADARWLAALGRTIADGWTIPDGVPYAAAPSASWPNAIVLAELAFWALDGVAGERGLALAQLVAVAAGFAVLGRAAVRAGASDGGTAVVLLLVGLGALSSLFVVRLQLFSLLLFPLLLALLHRETRVPSWRIWLLVPLVALWSNLHGAVLAGLAVAGAYLLLHRARDEPLTAIAVLGASTVALLLTPALQRTPDYYQGVLENEAARRGFGLWAPVSLTSPYDLLLVASAVVLGALALRSRPRLWELAAAAGLALLTVRTARSGVWLLFVLAVPAARGLGLTGAVRPRLVAVLVAVFALVTLGAVVRGPVETGAAAETVEAAIARAAGAPVLADPLPAEQVALAGGRVWLANPLDAFRLRDQRLYLDWLEGLPAGDAALERAGVVVTATNEPPELRLRRDPAWRRLREDGRSSLYVRR